MPTPTYTPDSWASNPKYKKPTQQPQQIKVDASKAAMIVGNTPYFGKSGIGGDVKLQGMHWGQINPNVMDGAMLMPNIPYYGSVGSVRNSGNKFMQQAQMQQQQMQAPTWAADMRPGWNFLGNNMQAGSMSAAQPVPWGGSPTTSAVQWAGGKKQGAYKDTAPTNPLNLTDLAESMDFTGQKRQQRLIEEAKAAAEKKKPQEQQQTTTAPFEMGTVDMLNGQQLPAISGLMNFDIPTPPVESLQQQQSGYPYPEYPWWMFGGGGGYYPSYDNNPAKWTQGLINWRI